MRPREDGMSSEVGARASTYADASETPDTMLPEPPEPSDQPEPRVRAPPSGVAVPGAPMTGIGSAPGAASPGPRDGSGSELVEPRRAAEPPAPPTTIVAARSACARCAATSAAAVTPPAPPPATCAVVPGCALNRQGVPDAHVREQNACPGQRLVHGHAGYRAQRTDTGTQAAAADAPRATPSAWGLGATPARPCASPTRRPSSEARCTGTSARSRWPASPPWPSQTATPDWRSKKTPGRHRDAPGATERSLALYQRLYTGLVAGATHPADQRPVSGFACR